MSRRNALLSVYNKNGIADFAKALVDLDYSLYSSGGTSTALRSAGLEVIDIADLVGGGAILNHKVVTLSRQIHGGLLVDRDDTDEMAQLSQMNAVPFDLVRVDFYPLEQEIANPDATDATVTTKTDVGGPTMAHAAAKGSRIVICDESLCGMVLEWLRNGEPNAEAMIAGLRYRAELAAAQHIMASARYHEQRYLKLCQDQGLPTQLIAA